MSERLLLRWRNTVASVDGPPSPTRRHVLMAIWWGQERARYYGGEARASVGDLVRWTGAHRSTVTRHLRIAESEGWARPVEAYDGVRWEPVLGEGAIT